LVERVDDDLVVYDEVSRSAHCLSPVAAVVWETCDGTLSAQEIGRELAVEPELVERALAELSDCGLLDEGPAIDHADRGYSRREAAAKSARFGAAAISGALIYSVAIPAAAAAASCIPTGTADPTCPAGNGLKAATAACCSGFCFNHNGSLTCVSATCLPVLGICTSGTQCCSGSCFLLVCTT
jgi:hypothetical protein